MKKAKVIVPALGLLLLSTAASISGTVAWFTAVRTYDFTAGEFAVVNTKDTLACELGEGIGTDVLENAVSVEDGSAGKKKLTDGSFDHTDYEHLPIIAPDLEGEKVGTKYDLATATESNLERATDTYTAFTWTATFSVTFGATADNDVGLFFDVANANTYCNGVYRLADGASVTGYYEDKAGTNAATGTADGLTDYYKAPSSTGKGFRVAIVPTAVGATSLGLARVWAPNQTAGNGTPANNKCTFVDGVGVGTSLNPSTTPAAAQAYSTVSSQCVNNAMATSTATSSALISSDDSALTIPNSTTTKTAALAMKNYMGFFKATANTTVSLTFKFVVWYEGSDENIRQTNETVFEKVTLGMQFGVYNLDD